MNKKEKLWIYALVCMFLLYSTGVSRAAENRYSGSTLDLDRIIVTPSRYAESYKNSSENVSVVDTVEVAYSGATEVSQILDTVPGLDVIDYGYLGSTKSVHSRGASSSQIITLINGRPANTPRDGETDINQIPLNNIDRIEVVRGPASSIYGANAVGGVINVITKSGREKAFTELDVKGGSFSTYMADLAHGWKIGKFDYFISANRAQSNGFRQNSDYEQNNYTVKLGYDVNKDNRLTLDAGYLASEVGLPGRNSDEDPDDRQEDWNHYADLTWEGALWGGSKTLFKVYNNTERLEFIESLSPILNKTASQTGVYGTDLQFSYTWFDALRTTIGASGQKNNINSSVSAKHRYNFEAAYAETELNLFNSLTLKGGARIDDYSNFGSRTSPSASFSYWFFDKIKAHGLIGKSFRAPTFNDLYWPKEDYGIWGGVEGNPNLKPEIATSREMGLGTFLFDKVETDVTYFYNKFKDMIAWQMDNSYWWRPSNVNTAITKGVETNLNYQATKRLKLNFNYTRLSALNNITDKWLIYRPRHEYKTTMHYNFNDKLNWYLTGRYVSKRYTTEDNSRFLKGYFAAYTNICYNVTKFSEINLTVNNIFDRNYQEEEDYPMPGASFLLGTKLRF